MGILEKHLGKGEPVKIGDDEIILKPLGTEYMGTFFGLMRSFKDLGPDATTSDNLDCMTDEAVENIKILIDATLALSLPDEPESDRKAFGMKYMSLLLEPIIKLNSADPSTTSNKKQEIINRMKAKQNETHPSVTKSTE